MAGRNELKYYINSAFVPLCHSRFSSVMQTDSHVLRDASYSVRSLYFDDPLASSYFDKVNGLEKRAKYRIRYYNGDLSYLRLEKKEKIGKKCFKTSEEISYEFALDLLSGRDLIKEVGPLSRELFLKIRYEGFRPLLFVDYERSAYLYPAGNVRITLDSAITASSYRGALEEGGITVPVLAPFETVLEVKYDEFFPPHLSVLLEDIPKVFSAISKFCKAREILS